MALLAFVSAALYIAAAFLSYRGRLATDTNRTIIPSVIGAVACIGQILYTVQIFWVSGGVDMSIIPIASLVATPVAMIILAELFFKPARATPLVLVAYPLVALFLVAAGLLHRGSLHTTPLSTGLTLHVVVSIAAYSILVYAACQAALLIWLDKAIRNHANNAFLNLFAPLESAEVALFNALWTGLALLTVSTATGFVFFWGQLFTHVSHLHVILTFGAWLVYAALMLGHVLRGWRGNFTTRLSLVAFGLLLVGYFGTKIAIEIFLGPTA